MAKGYTGVCPRDMTNATVLGEPTTQATTQLCSYLTATQTYFISWWHCCPEAKLTALRWKAAAQSSFAFTSFETQVKQNRIGHAGWQQFGHLY